MLLITASVVLGNGEERGWRPAKAPRYALAALHRTVSMLALAALAVHIVTTIADPFPKIGIGAAFIPFATNYRSLWMGLGTVASDLLVALVITSLVRRRLGYRAWRAVHWAAYACWPVAILHGLGTGSDTKSTWMLALTLGAVAAVLVAVLARLARPGTPSNVRIGATSAATLSVIGLAVWLPGGPLGSGWAKRAGTPSSVLNAFKPKPVRNVTRTASAPADPFAHSFSASFSGLLREGASAGGLEVVDLKLRLSGSPDGILRIRLGGPPLPGGGLRMDRSAVTLGPPGAPAQYRGRVDFLQNTVLRAKVGSAAGRALRLDVNLTIGNNTVQGTVNGTPLV
jgi:sulfoxide reductase heme-binding subunit YedZ